MSDREPTELESALAALPEGTIKYEATFVPYSKVSEERRRSWGDGKNLFLSWTVTINGERFDYSAGIGHISNPKIRAAAMNLRGWTIYEKEAITEWAEGRWLPLSGSVHGSRPFNKLPIDSPNRQTPPDLADVIHCLVLELDSLDYDFEEWADNYGYDKDSRKAEKTYRECREQAYRTLRALGAETAEKLRGLEH